MFGKQRGAKLKRDHRLPSLVILKKPTRLEYQIQVIAKSQRMKNEPLEGEEGMGSFSLLLFVFSFLLLKIWSAPSRFELSSFRFEKKRGGGGGDSIPLSAKGGYFVFRPKIETFFFWTR